MSSKSGSIKITNNGKLDKRFKSTQSIQNEISGIKMTKQGKPDKRTSGVKNGKIKVKISDGKVKGSSKIGKNMALL
jgi:hypothetical protein